MLTVEDYSQSRVHRDRKRSMANECDSRTPRRDSNVTGTATSAIPEPSKRPSMPYRYSSNGGSVTDTVFGTSYQTSHSYSQSRRPSDAVIAEEPGVRSRTYSVSSNSTDYGTEGIYGWRGDHDTGGYYGWKQDGTRR